MKIVKTDDPDTVAACPECDTAGDVYERATTSDSSIEDTANNRTIDPDKPYVCYKCMTGIDDFVERPPKPRSKIGGEHDGMHNINPKIRELVETYRNAG